MNCQIKINLTIYDTSPCWVFLCLSDRIIHLIYQLNPIYFSFCLPIFPLKAIQRKSEQIIEEKKKNNAGSHLQQYNINHLM